MLQKTLWLIPLAALTCAVPLFAQEEEKPPPSEFKLEVPEAPKQLSNNPALNNLLMPPTEGQTASPTAADSSLSDDPEESEDAFNERQQKEKAVARKVKRKPSTRNTKPQSAAGAQHNGHAGRASPVELPNVVPSIEGEKNSDAPARGAARAQNVAPVGHAKTDSNALKSRVSKPGDSGGAKATTADPIASAKNNNPMRDRSSQPENSAKSNTMPKSSNAKGANDAEEQERARKEAERRQAEEEMNQLFNELEQ